MKGEEASGVRIKESIDRLPGGLMLAPLLLGALCKTFAPNAPAYFKGFTQGIMTGVIPILAVWFFCMGSSIKLSATGTVLRKSGTLVLTKFFAAWAIVLVASQFIPPEGIQSGFFAGLSILAIVCAVDMTNGGLYASLMQTYGTKEEAGAFVLTSIESGPLMSMIILGASGAAHFEPQVFVGAVLPFLVGFALGNLDPKLREFFAPGGLLMIPFFAFALGNTIDLHTLLSPLAGLGVVLALSVIRADRRAADHRRQADRTRHGHGRHRRLLHRRRRGRQPCGDCRRRSAICACGRSRRRCWWRSASSSRRSSCRSSLVSGFAVSAKARPRRARRTAQGPRCSSIQWTRTARAEIHCRKSEIKLSLLHEQFILSA